MFKMEIQTGGAAFCNPDTGEEDKTYEAFELAILLVRVKDKILSGEESGVCIDTNGNKVGSWSRQEETSWKIAKIISRWRCLLRFVKNQNHIITEKSINGGKKV